MEYGTIEQIVFDLKL